MGKSEFLKAVEECKKNQFCKGAQLFHRLHRKEELKSLCGGQYHSTEPLGTFSADEEYDLTKLGYTYDEIENMTKKEQWKTLLDEKGVDYKDINMKKELVMLDGVFCYPYDPKLGFHEDSGIRFGNKGDVMIVFEGIDTHYPSQDETVAQVCKIKKIIPYEEL